MSGSFTTLYIFFVLLALFISYAAQQTAPDHVDTKIHQLIYTLVKSLIPSKTCYVIAKDGWKFEIENPDTVTALQALIMLLLYSYMLTYLHASSTYVHMYYKYTPCRS